MPGPSPARFTARAIRRTLQRLARLWNAPSLRTLAVAQHRPDGFNIGVNVGAAAGQTVPHLHVHVIPRYEGDVPDPRGGVRHVSPGRGNYLAM